MRYAVYDFPYTSKAWGRGEARRRGAEGTLWIQGWYTPRKADGSGTPGVAAMGDVWLRRHSPGSRIAWRGLACRSRAGRRCRNVYHLVPSSPSSLGLLSRVSCRDCSCHVLCTTQSNVFGIVHV